MRRDVGGPAPRWVQSWNDQEGVEQATTLFEKTYGTEPDGVWAAPGRINLIGEHVDYCGGLCLPMALPHRTFIALRGRADQQVELVTDLDSGHWSGSTEDLRPGGVTGWAAYAAGPAWSLTQEAGLSAMPHGFDAAIVSCVPLGAGLSSSAALGCASIVALDDIWGLGMAADDTGRTTLATACVKAENEVVGAPTGGMDQAISLRATAGHAMLLDCRDGAAEQVEFDATGAELSVLVIDTRAPHSLSDGQYGQRRTTCEEAAAALGVADLREIADQVDEARDRLDEVLNTLPDDLQRRRTRHVVNEIQRVRRSATYLRGGLWAELGVELNVSHDSLRHDYEVSCAELDTAVEAARAAGALGARMTGGGFGGSAIALIRTSELENAANTVAEAFRVRGFRTPSFLVAEPCAGARRVR